MSDPAERRIGSVIAGKWRVDSLLGSGSMAAVYAVTHRNGARAALKILHPTLCADEGVCERFLGEGYLTNSVKHPGIVRVLDDGVTDDGCVFLVMDLLEGKTLEALRQDRGGQIGLVEILDIADKLMDVLHAVHESGIIHRDLKPQNVFICDDGTVKLLDFGVARVLDSGARSKLSLFGLVLGTPSFMSPEQALGSRDKVDHCSDIWSLGATLFTAITGQTVHLGPHVQAKLLAAATVKARSISMVKQDLPAPIAAAIDTALRFKKEDRWQSVDAFRRALREARRELGLGKPESVPPPGWADAPDFDTTQIDTGERIGPVVVRTSAQPPPVPKKTGEPAVDGRTRTMIGIGGLEGGGTGTVPHIPAAARLGPVDPDAAVGAARAAVSAPPRVAPAAIIRSPIESRPDGTADGSYPAVGSTVKLHDTDPLMAQVGTRRSGAGVWIAGCLLAVAAVGGVAFLAVNRSSASDAQGATTAQTPLMSATAPISSAVIAPAPTPAPLSRIDARDLVKDASATTDSPMKASVTAPPPPRTGPAAQPPIVRAPTITSPTPPAPQPTTNTNNTTRPAATQDPSPAQPPAPAPPAPVPTVPPDPFGTPE